MIPDSLAPGIVIRAPDKTSVRESGDEPRSSSRLLALNGKISKFYGYSHIDSLVFLVTQFHLIFHYDFL